MIYEERQTQLAEGEKIAWLKTDNSAQGKHNKIKNGLTGTIERIDGDQLTVKTELGHTVQIQGQDAYITNAQAITGHKAQGATEHTGLLSISADDKLATQNMLYVLTTRQTHDLVAFVDDKEALIENLRSETKASSLEEQKVLLKDLTAQLQAIHKVETDSDYSRTADNFFDVVDKMEQDNRIDRQRFVEQELRNDGDIHQQAQQLVNVADQRQHQQERDQGLMLEM
jgi:hypothetical protein